MTIAEQVQQMGSKPSPLPTEIRSVFEREQSALADAAAPEVMPIGSALPDVELLDPHGERITLSAVLAGRRAVLVFYRGAWCPYCNIALNAYQTDLLEQLEARGVALVAVSPQTPDGSLSIQEKHDLRFAVLSDPGSQLARHLGILTAPSSEGLAAQRQLGLDLTVVNADGTASLPMPATLIVEPDLTMRWIDVHPDYTTRTESRQILDALDVLDAA